MLCSRPDAAPPLGPAPAPLDFTQRGLFPSSGAPVEHFVGVIEFDQRVVGPPSLGARPTKASNTYPVEHPWYALRVEQQRYPLIGDEFPELYPFAGKTVLLKGKMETASSSLDGSGFTYLLPGTVELRR